MKPTFLSPTEVYEKKKESIWLEVNYELDSLNHAKKQQDETEIARATDRLKELHKDLTLVQEKLSNKSPVRIKQTSTV